MRAVCDNVARRGYGTTAIKKGKVLAATTGFPRSPPTRKKDKDSKVSTVFSSHVTRRWCRHGAGPIREKAYRVACFGENKGN